MAVRKAAKLIAILVVVLALAGTAHAHEGWVQAYSPIVGVGEMAYVDMLFGNHSNEHGSYRIAGKWNLKESRVFVTTPDGEKTDITAHAFDTGEDAEEVGPKGVKGYHAVGFTPGQPGLHMVSVEGDSLFKHGETTVRTLRSAKTFVAAAGTPVRAHVTDMKGFDRQATPDRMELAPLFNPAAVTPGAGLTFQLFMKGKPAGGQHVTVIQRSNSQAIGYHADAEGKVSFEAGAPDYYLIRVKHESEEKEAGKYDKTAYEATMTFIVQGGGRQHDGGKHADGSKHDMHMGDVNIDAAASGLEIIVNGKALAAHWEIKNGRAFVPIDPLAEALGLTVGFNPKKPEHGVMLQRKGLYLHLHTDEQDAHVGGRTVQLDAPAVYFMTGKKAGLHAMAPIRFVAETFGATVEYKAATAQAPATIIVTPAP